MDVTHGYDFCIHVCLRVVVTLITGIHCIHFPYQHGTAQ